MADSQSNGRLNKKRKHSPNPPLIPFVTNELWPEEELEIIVKDTIRNLKNENDKEKDNIHPMKFLISGDVGFKLIWEAVKEFDLPVDCKFIALELFHKFVVKQLDSLLGYISKTDKHKNKGKLIKELEKRLRSQSPLRALTCVMIASKLASNKKAIDAEIMYHFIQKMDINFTKRQIVRSETRVLEQLEYKCSHTSFIMVCVGIMVTAVGLKRHVIKEVKQVRAEHLYKASIYLLDFAYLNHDKIYKELFYLITGSRVISENLRTAYARVVADRFLLAASTVAGGSWVLGGNAFCSAVISCLNRATNLPVEDVESVTACLLHIAGLSE
ncbi:cyclin N-terminal domain-containing protein 1-like [Macrobrachium rosenbergii]|uniref:cyclin N-terminal domain-containing protein 1-like n=1 Tax=Macrobrachium rosenbergii TaxID=79674 RepID=UPI0034D5DF2D